jgi:hypothetical protein
LVLSDRVRPTMRSSAIAIALFGAFASAPVHTLAADDRAGSPEAPSDATGSWTLVAGGRAICVVDLGEEKISAGSFALTVPLACGNAIPASVVAWAPAANGVSLVGLDDRSVVGFRRLSGGLLVSHRSGGADLVLQRGSLNPQGQSTVSER